MLSVDVEWVFSVARHTLSYRHSHLSVKTVQGLLCVGEWLKASLMKDKDLHGCLHSLKDDQEEEDDSDFIDDM